MKKLTYLLVFCFSLSALALTAQMDQDALTPLKDIQHLDDVIISGGSLCVGFDCVNGESFGFDTHRLKENNVRIHFLDTSTSSSFPSNDWRIRINDTSNGGGNYFAVEDATAGRTPFLIEAGAKNNSLYVDDGSRVGLGTSSPVVELHVVDGDTPTLRLEQDGSSGFTAQTWDLASNETNFFIRDATNGSKLPFRIKPGAPTNSIYIDSDGDIGLGDSSPDAKLDIESGDLLVTNGKVEINGAGNTSATYGLKVENSDGDMGLYVGDDGKVGIGKENPERKLHILDQSDWVTTFFESDFFAQNRYYSSILIGSEISFGQASQFGHVYTGNNNTSFAHITPWGKNEGSVLSILFNGNIGMGTISPSTQLEISGIPTKPGGGSWSAPSDKRLKKNIKTYDEGLEKILSFKPVSFQYNGKGGIKDTEKTYVGLIAQEAQEVAPHMVSDVARGTTVKNGDEETTTYEDYLMLDPSAITYMLINAVKEQQTQLDAKDEKIESLESKVDKLQDVVTALIQRIDGEGSSSAIDVLNEEDVTLSIASLPYLRQNVPNPYGNQTSINYFIPESSDKAVINFYDNQGRLLKTHTLSQKGEGILNVKNKDLPSGTYVYSLIVDGKMVSSKKMSVQ